MNVQWDMEALFESPQTHRADGYDKPGVEAIFFENEAYKGASTEVFAWMGLPYLKTGQTCPAMVLLHGGGGTAFDEWVRLWNRRGYAAIAFDQCGCVPNMPGPVDGIQQERHQRGGPPGWDESFGRAHEPVEDQWPYHAVAAALRAHSILANRPEVDASRIGVTGISWGGYLTCLVAAVDERLKGAIPVYGCGFLGENSVWNDNEFPSLDPQVVERWLTLWDPSAYLPEARMPFCWLNGTNDLAYPLDSFRKSYLLTGTERALCMRVEMPHSHPDGWAPPEIGVFADSVLAEGAPLPRITASGSSGNVMWAEYRSARPVMRAELNYTRGTGHWADRKYNILPADVDRQGSRVEVEIPAQTSVCFLNLYDDRECVASTDLMVAE